MFNLANFEFKFNSTNQQTEAHQQVRESSRQARADLQSRCASRTSNLQNTTRNQYSQFQTQTTKLEGTIFLRANFLIIFARQSIKKKKIAVFIEEANENEGEHGPRKSSIEELKAHLKSFVKVR